MKISNTIKPFKTARIASFHFSNTPVSFRSIPTLAFPIPKAKTHASPAVNGSCLHLSFLGFLHPPPLLHSQSARALSYKTTFRSSIPFFRFANAAQGCFTCVVFFQSHTEKQYLYYMEIAKGFKSDDYNNLNLDTPHSDDWESAIQIFTHRFEPRYLEPIRLLIQTDAKLPVRERKFGFTIMAISCLLIEALYSFRNGIVDNRNNGKPTFVDFLTKSDSFKPYFDIDSAEIFYDHIRNGILHQAETKEKTLIRDVGPLVRKINDSISINRTAFFEQLENEFHIYVDGLSNPVNIVLRTHFKTKMDHICKKP
ncbi:hypothetical protein HNS38_10265 [Lentimicrobium sp. L6]|uniref:hypothetical protein n=1 Tax=Lentimicrobium sp. L6 TaxID=2735916 RepID=UPI0015573B49|nr:hypothetical protein [Lentimicrobium sp. L6]NPD85145.1 hypothetical protein [Lentimicrobium sp. L6]